MDPVRGTFDRELDSPPGLPPGIPVEALPACQRIIVNPLLGVLSWLVTFALIRLAVKNRSSTLFLLGVCLLFAAFLVQQFHCLDCGATGWLVRYRRHACPSVVARYRQRDVRRFRVPRVMTQIAIWFYLITGTLVLLLILFGPRR